ncbi:hypothetical protein MtrunA17_Chr2g0324391 [Medicago truncatula]|uniref:Uncharacterized protein n=1 Tax=Medicago truncatula TaxID=3880 RepID=A0A396JBS5_MEDTR|nr:hypothetical protein MtrunA17_Chr2g0324391 [Medicago truncatula]
MLFGNISVGGGLVAWLVRPAQVTVETIAVAAAVMAADTEKIVVQSILTEVDEPQLAGLGEDAGSM